MTQDRWNSTQVAERMREAADTLRLLPDHHPGKRYRGAWPDFPRDPREAYGYGGTDPRPAPPSAAAIDRMDEVLTDWTARVDAEEARLMWGWALGVPAAAVARQAGFHRSTVHRRRLAAFKKLAVILNSAGQPVRTAESDRAPEARQGVSRV